MLLRKKTPTFLAYTEIVFQGRYVNALADAIVEKKPCVYSQA